MPALYSLEGSAPSAFTESFSSADADVGGSSGVWSDGIGWSAFRKGFRVTGFSGQGVDLRAVVGRGLGVGVGVLGRR